ncbi:MAG TPA: hypothetical protein VKA63_02605, partial [Candidatus Krumholzibacteria bacterium]|nr:hypothetical protein [Candidatus Krumholzibacteria bacterium]
MSWGVPYDSSVDSLLENTWLVELLEEDYAGATTTLPGGGPQDGYVIDWGEEDRDIDEPIIASVATVKLVDKTSALFDWLTDTAEG